MELRPTWQAAQEVDAVQSAAGSDATAELAPEALVARSQQGCEHSFERLIALFETRIFNYLVRLLRNTHDAEDVAQDTFLKAFKSLHRFDTSGSFSTWLFTIAKHTALNHIRSARRVEKLEPYDDVVTDNPSDATVRADEASAVWSAAKELKPQFHEALWLRYAEGFSLMEMARIMGVNPISAKVILHRARNALGKKLKQARLSP